MNPKDEAAIRGLKNGQKVICKTDGQASLAGQIKATEKEFAVYFAGGHCIELDGAVFTVEKKQDGDFGTILTF